MKKYIDLNENDNSYYVGRYGEYGTDLDDQDDMYSEYEEQKKRIENENPGKSKYAKLEELMYNVKKKYGVNSKLYRALIRERALLEKEKFKKK